MGLYYISENLIFNAHPFWTLDELALKSEVGIRKSEQGLKQAFFGGFSAFRLPISDFGTGFSGIYASVQNHLTI